MKKIFSTASIAGMVCIVVLVFLQLAFIPMPTVQHHCCDQGPASGSWPPWYSDSDLFGNNYVICDDPTLSANYDITDEVNKGGCKFTTAGCTHLWNYGYYNCSKCDDFDYSGDQHCKTYSLITTCATYAGAILEVTENNTDFGTSTTTISNCFTVKNYGSQTLNWNTSGNKNWITNISPSWDNISPGVSENVSVTVDRDELSYAELENVTNNDTITVSGTPENKYVTISVYISAPSAPSNLDVPNAGSWGEHPYLTWSGVSLASKYKIERKVNSGSWSQIA